MSINKNTYMKWQEDGRILLMLNDDHFIISIEPVDNHLHWREYSGEAAWDCDYFNLTEKEIEWLENIEWRRL